MKGNDMKKSESTTTVKVLQSNKEGSRFKTH